MLYDLARIDIKIKLGSDPGPLVRKWGPIATQPVYRL